MAPAPARTAPPTRIETPRLVGTPLGRADYLPLCRLHRDRAVARSLGGPRDPLWVHAHLDAIEAHWATHGFGWWGFRERDGDAWVGRGGLSHSGVPGLDAPDVAYALLPAYWGRGFATEIARASVAHGFGALGLAAVLGFTLPANRASQAVLRKAGLTWRGRFRFHGYPHLLFRADAPAP